MLTVASDDDARALQRLRHLRADAVLVALLRDPVPLSYRRVLRAGASAAACWDAVPAALVEVVRSALGGLCLLPIGVAHHLAHAAAGEAGDGRAPPLDEEQVGWLRCLADGSTVAGLAHSAGYSEREMYRLLSALYRSMGVRSRTEALVRATSMGLIDGCQQRARAAPPVAPHRPTAR
jgi:DNA-binding NarL/FixJ family response regulator